MVNVRTTPKGQKKVKQKIGSRAQVPRLKQTQKVKKGEKAWAPSDCPPLPIKLVPIFDPARVRLFPTLYKAPTEILLFSGVPGFRLTRRYYFLGCPLTLTRFYYFWAACPVTPTTWCSFPYTSQEPVYCSTSFTAIWSKILSEHYCNSVIGLMSLVRWKWCSNRPRCVTTPLTIFVLAYK